MQKENIKLNKDEFNFQLKSHPDFPSLLSIVDTLDFFSIVNGAIQVAQEEMDALPNCFLAYLKNESGTQSLHFFEKINNLFFVDSESVSNEYLNDKWTGNVLLIEKNEGNNNSTVKKRTFEHTIFSFYILISVLLLFYSNRSYNETFFYVFPILGIFLTSLTIKDLFNLDSVFLNKFCNVLHNSDCENISHSTKWKIFSKINFSDLSMTFFSAQFFSLIVYSFFSTVVDYFGHQVILLLMSTPLILISIYYQKFVERKWCSVCLAIILLLILEFSYIAYFFQPKILMNGRMIIFSLFILGSSFIGWIMLKRLLLDRKKLKQQKIKLLRFRFNYNNFKNNLLSEGKFKSRDDTIIFDSNKSKLDIKLVTSLQCKFCGDAHETLERIFFENKDKLHLDLIFNVDVDSLPEDWRTVYRNIAIIQIERETEFFVKAISDWFKIQDLTKWLDLYQKDIDTNKADEIIKNHKNICEYNEINFTPGLIVQGHFYPDSYDIDDLKFFVKDLIEDLENK